MKNKLCIKCHERPILNKKRGLCGRCYQLYRNSQGDLLKDENRILSKSAADKWHEKGEIEFIKNFFNHFDWVHQPAVFALNGIRYKPDFYDVKRNTFIEVSSTRQAYHANKHKYDLFRALYPKLNFEIRKPNGELLNEENRDKHW